METIVTLPFPPRMVGGVVTLVGLALATFLVYALLSGGPRPRGKGRVQRQLGLDDVSPGVFLIAAIAWGVLAAVLFYGLLALVLDVLWHPMAQRAPSPVSRFLSGLSGEAAGEKWDFRFRLAQMAALAGVLGAVVALPLTLNRLRLTRESNETAREALFNQKITEAAADLHAQRQVTKHDGNGKAQFNGWEDDVARRNAAIDRLEGLVRERSETAPDKATAERVARLLSVYLRELSREYPVKRHVRMDLLDRMHPSDDSPPLTEEEALQTLGVSPDEAYTEALRDWAQTLEPARSDMQNAAQTLGRLTKTCGLAENTIPIDLRKTNLQGFDLSGLDFRKAHLAEAQLQGAYLGGARLDGANFGSAQLQGAHLGGAQLQGAHLGQARLEGAYLGWAQLQGADLWCVRLQGADLRGARLDELTDLSDATLRGASLRYVDDLTAKQLRPFWPDIFADGSVEIREEERPAHWAHEKLRSKEFNEAWRAWQRSIGMDPDDPQ